LERVFEEVFEVSSEDSIQRFWGRSYMVCNWKFFFQNPTRDTMKKILKHLILWTMKHDPPRGEKDRIALHIQSIGVLSGVKL
jgi:hypothetical protein